MLTVAQDSPSPNNDKKPSPDWSFQVKVGRGRADTGAHHRAIDLAEKLFANGQWDGRGLLILHEVYDTHARAQLLGAALVEGVDYEFGEDSLYRREEAAAVDLSQVVKVCRASESRPPRFMGYLADGSEVAMTPAQFEQWMVL